MGKVTLNTEPETKPLTLFQLVGAVTAGYLAWTSTHSVFWTALCALLNWVYIAGWILFRYLH